MPSTSTSPLVGTSRLPAIVNRVLLPEPLGPITATNAPASTDKSTLRSACTSVGPSPYTFETPRSSSALTAAPPRDDATSAPATAPGPEARADRRPAARGDRRPRPATGSPNPAGTTRHRP